MNGDPKVVAAFAVAVLLLPPVVNALMIKAAHQVDMDWLRDSGIDPSEDLDPDDFDPDDFDGPPPPVQMERPPPPPTCQLVNNPRATQSVAIFGPADGSSPRVSRIGILPEPGDLRVVAFVYGQDFAGAASFIVREDGSERWRYASNQTLNVVPPQTDFFPMGEQGKHYIPTDAAWSLEYDVSRATFERMDISIFTVRCVEEGA